MNCKTCERPLFKYDDTHVTCKIGHVWTLEQADDQLVMPGDATPVRLVNAKSRAWLPGAVLGGLALAVEIVSQLLT